MYDIGLLTTKSVWVLDGASNGYFKGSTCNDKEYLNWILEIKSKGFEIGYHMAKYESSKREETQKALEKFKNLFGDYPSSMANHSQCKDNIYWGSSRLTGFNRIIYNLMTLESTILNLKGMKKIVNIFGVIYVKIKFNMLEILSSMISIP